MVKRARVFILHWIQKRLVLMWDSFSTFISKASESLEKAIAEIPDSPLVFNQDETNVSNPVKRASSSNFLPPLSPLKEKDWSTFIPSLEEVQKEADDFSLEGVTLKEFFSLNQSDETAFERDGFFPLPSDITAEFLSREDYGAGAELMYRYNELWGIITVNSGILHDEAQFCHDQVQEAMRISHNAQREFLMLKDKLEMVPTMLGHMDNFKERFDKLKKRVGLLEELLTEEIEIFMAENLRLTKEKKLRELEQYKVEADQQVEILRKELEEQRRKEFENKRKKAKARKQYSARSKEARDMERERLKRLYLEEASSSSFSGLTKSPGRQRRDASPSTQSTNSKTEASIEHFVPDHDEEELENFLGDGKTPKEETLSDFLNIPDEYQYQHFFSDNEVEEEIQAEPTSDSDSTSDYEVIIEAESSASSDNEGETERRIEILEDDDGLFEGDNAEEKKVEKAENKKGKQLNRVFEVMEDDNGLEEEFKVTEVAKNVLKDQPRPPPKAQTKAAIPKLATPKPVKPVYEVLADDEGPEYEEYKKTGKKTETKRSESSPAAKIYGEDYESSEEAEEDDGKPAFEILEDEDPF